MKPVEISRRNIMFTEKMGEEYDLNIGLIMGKRHNFIIDTGLGSGSVKPILEYIKDSRKPIIVINTHFHWDHIWGNWVFKEDIIISHRKCYEFENKYWEKAFEKFSEKADGEVQKALPNLVFDKNLYFPEDGIELFFTPGHSADAISIYDQLDKVLYAGDNIGDTADEIVPYIDTDMETFKSTIELYKNYDFDYCISGHNKPQGKDIAERMDIALEKSWEKQIEKWGLPEKS